MLRLNSTMSAPAREAATCLLAKLSAAALAELTSLVAAFDRAWQEGQFINGLTAERYHAGIVSDWCEDHDHARNAWEALLTA